MKQNATSKIFYTHRYVHTPTSLAFIFRMNGGVECKAGRRKSNFFIKIQPAAYIGSSINYTDGTIHSTFTTMASTTEWVLAVPTETR